MSKFLIGTALALSMAALSTPAFAQQTGTVIGHVTQVSGATLAGVTVVATSPVLPSQRSTTSGANGYYQLPLLPPGNYLLTFKKADGTVIKREAAVLLQQRIDVDVTFGENPDTIIITGSREYYDTGRGSLKDTLDTATVTGVPIGQDYRDLQKLIPGVQYTEDQVRGPSAGGSGQDNIYQFDGVDVSLPLFGTLSSEPSTQDVAGVSIIRGGATARGFNRSGGFTINTTSKSGTNKFHAESGYRIQTSGLTSSRQGISSLQFQEDKKWITANIGGPVIKDKLFLYGSYYRPTVSRPNASNALGSLPKFTNRRNEYYGKMTFTPTNNILLNASYRTSDRTTRNSGVGAFGAPSTSTGATSGEDIAIVEGSWIPDDKSSISFKFTDFRNKNSSRPDNLFNLNINQGDALSISTLDQQGLFIVPQLIANPANSADQAFNAFVQPIISQYGFQGSSGGLTGGGTIGGASTINDQNFDRTSYEGNFDRTINFGKTTHDIHFGYQYESIGENLARSSNGYGSISVPGGLIMASDGVTPVFFEARTQAVSINGLAGAGGTVVPKSIRSRSHIQSFELNDSVEAGDFKFNLGVLVSHDTLYGQGLKAKAGTLSGFEVAPGNRYKMKTIKWKDMIQPRLGINWNQSDRNAFYVNFARYNPPASSLARAASWDRNIRRSVRVRFDANGNFIEVDPVRSSSGKRFQKGIKPRRTDEYIAGWNRQVSDSLTVRLHYRYRHATRFWEDTGNSNRLLADAPPDIQAKGLYIPDLNNIRAEIGGSSFVIAQLDTAHTKYNEIGLEAEFHTDNLYFLGSYTYSRFRGNFDQDNTTTSNDANSFIGSSFIADGAGRQLWNNRQGKLRGDRPHMFKLYGYYKLPWNGQVGLLSIYQSGQPWEKWSVTPFRGLTGSRSDTSRFAEAAGSRRTSGHFQLDLNYAQNLTVLGGRNIQFKAELFNVFDSQTGFNIQNKFNSAGFGTPRSRFAPRRLQLAVVASF